MQENIVVNVSFSEDETVVEMELETPLGRVTKVIVFQDFDIINITHKDGRVTISGDVLDRSLPDED